VSQLPKHILVTLIVAFVIVLLGGGGWYWTSSQLGSALNEKQTLETQMNALARGVYYPSAQNVEALEKNVEMLRAGITPLMERMAEADAPLEPIQGRQVEGGGHTGLTGDAWQKLLSAQRVELLQAAQEGGVELPEDFFLGFQRYRALVPNAEVTYPLGVQLVGIDTILESMVGAKVVAIREIKRVMVEEGEGATRATGVNALGARILESQTGHYRVYPFEFVFQASPEALYSVVDQITNSELFLIIRFLDLQNEKTSLPSKSEVISENRDTQANIIPVLGQEQLRIRMRVDLIDWTGAAEEAEEGGQT